MAEQFLDEGTTKNLVQQYNATPWAFADSDFEFIHNNAVANNIPFARSDFDHSFSLERAMSEMTKQFFSGLAGPLYNPESEAKNDAEAIAGAIGHLAGFVGVIPIYPLGGLLQRTGVKTLQNIGKAVSKVHGASVPMIAGSIAEGMLQKPARFLLSQGMASKADVIKSASRILGSEVGKQVISGGTKLAVASGVSDLAHGVDQALMSSAFGFLYGGGFKIVGNAIRMGDPMAEKFARGLASSLFDGLPATIQERSTPEQVYAYLTGAYFGYKELPAHQEAGYKHIAKMRELPEHEGVSSAHYTKPQQVRGWEDLSPEAQRFAYDFWDANIKQEQAVILRIAADMEAGKTLDQSVDDYYKHMESLAKEELAIKKELDERLELGDRITKEDIEGTPVNEKSYGLSPSKDLPAVDPGEEATYNIFRARAEYFVDRELAEVWNGDYARKDELVREMDDFYRELTARSMEGEEFNFYKEMAAKFKHLGGDKIKDTEALERMYSTMITLAAEKERMGVVGTDEGIRFVKNGEQIKETGYRVFSNSAESELELIWKDIAKGREDEQVFYVLENYNFGAKNVSRSELLKSMQKAARKTGEDPDKLFKDYAARIRNQFYEKGYLYFGGRGDAERDYWVKRHPVIERMTEGRMRRLVELIHDRIIWSTKDPAQRKLERRVLNLDKEAYRKEGRLTEWYETYLNNVLWDLEMNGRRVEGMDMRTLLDQVELTSGGGFVNSAVKYNKRFQIIHTSATPIPMNYLRKVLGDELKVRYVLVDDPDGKDTNVMSPAKDYAEPYDGATLLTNSFLKALLKSAGMMTTAGRIKFFSVTKDPTLGAMFMKHMGHNTTDGGNEAMERRGIHMIVRDSSAKQRGTRKSYKYDAERDVFLDKDGKEVEPEVYEMPAQDFRVTLTERVDTHSLENQMLPKPVMGLFNMSAENPMDLRVLHDMFDTAVVQSLQGDPEYNSIIRRVNSPGIGKKERAKLRKQLLNNLDEVGIDQIIGPTGVLFGTDRKLAFEVVHRILKGNTSEAERLYAEGEITAAELAEVNRNQLGFEDTTAKIMRSGEMIENPGAIITFSPVKQYVEVALKNYAVRRVTRPKLKNSVSLRMAQYDELMQRVPSMSRLMDDDEVFYLAKDVGKKEILTDIPGFEKTTLGELWDAYESKSAKLKGYDEAVQEVFRAAVVRVPMDSISGLHALRFAGFAPVEGLAIYLHPRTMAALGGADLDGDKAFAFFGGRGGFKGSWKNEYHKNKFEFYEKAGKGYKGDRFTVKGGKMVPDENGEYTGKISDNKAGYKEDLILQDPDLLASSKSRVLQYSGRMRQMMSWAASEGRQRLGSAVNFKSHAIATFNRAVKHGPIEMEITVGKGAKKVTHEIVAVPKTDAKSKALFNAYSRTMIALSSDPMDEAGLTKWMDARNLMMNHLFEYRFKSGAKVESDRIISEANSAVLKEASGLNSVLWGKNTAAGRAWTPDQVQATLSKISDREPVSMLEMAAQALKNRIYTNHPLRQLSEQHIDRFYKLYNEAVVNPEYLPLARAFNRIRREELGGVGEIEGPAMSVTKPEIFRVFYGLGLENNDFLPKKFQNREKMTAIWRWLHRKADKETMRRQMRYAETAPLGTLERRIVTEIKARSADFLQNDMMDMASFNVFLRGNLKIPKQEVFEDMINRITAYKLMASMHWRSKKNQPKEGVYNDVRIEGLPQEMIDQMVIKDMQGMNANDRRVYTQLYLGTLSYVDKNMRTTFSERRDQMEKNGFDVEAINDQIAYFANDTRRSTSGWMSRAVGNLDRAHFLATYGDIENTLMTDPLKLSDNMHRIFGQSAQHVKDMVEGKVTVSEGLRKPPNTIAGLQQNLAETRNDLKDARIALSRAETIDMANKASDKDMEFKHEWQHKVYSELSYYLQKYHNSIGEHYIPFLREIFHKDPLAYGKQDYINLINWFKSVEDGTFVQRMADKFIDGGLTSPKLGFRHWHIFPDMIHREFMKYGFEIDLREGAYIDEKGEAKVGIVGDTMTPILRSQKAISTGNRLAEAFAQQARQDINTQLLPFTDGKETGQFGRELFEAAISDVIERKHWSKIAKAAAEDPQNESLIKKAEVYREEREKSLKNINWKELQHKKFKVELGDGNTVELTGREVAERIAKVVEDFFLASRRLLKGGGGIPYNEKIVEILRNDYMGEGKYPVAIGLENLLRMHDEHFRRRALERLGKTSMFEFNPRPRKPIEFLDEGYWVHYNLDHADMIRYRDAEIKKIEQMDIPDRMKVKRIAATILNYAHRTGDYNISETLMSDQGLMVKALEQAGKRQDAGRDVNWADTSLILGTTQAREANIPGWDKSVESLNRYIDNTYSQIYKVATQIILNEEMHRFEFDYAKKLGLPPDQVEAWMNFHKMYLQDALGNPSVIPHQWLDKGHYLSDSMKVRGTPYAWMADSTVRDFLDGLMRKLGIRKPKSEAQEIVDKYMKRLDYTDISRWGQMEANYQLATLLMHPKSAVQNIFGGTTNTGISVGIRTLANARSIEYLRANVNPNWRSMEDVTKWVSRLGIIDEFLRVNLQSNPIFKKGRWESFGNDLKRWREADPDSKGSLSALMKKHGITDEMMYKAGFFMRGPERVLRRDAFIAHYLKARSIFGNALPWDHPVLIQMAMKGVHATQFMYSSAFRPAFARTSLGKVMTRFQLWAWNSFRFRREIYREAAIYGFRPGTSQFERFKRLFFADMLVMALAQSFAYSIFEMSIPTPYNYLEDFSQWIFGDEKERDRAFFGSYPTAVAPLQTITPPAARIIGPTVEAMISGDWNRMVGYHIPVLFPMGRILRSAYQTYENPTRALDIWTGIPLLQFPKFRQDSEDEYFQPFRSLL